MSEPRSEDREVLVRAQAGEDEAIDALARRWRPYVLAICRGFFAGAEDAEDAAQTSLIRFIAHVGSLKIDHSPAPYVAAITRNACREILGARAKEPASISACPCGADGPCSGVDPSAGTSSDPAAAAVAADVQRHLEHCLRTLQPRSRMLLELHFLDGIPRDRLHEHWPAALPFWRIKQTLSNWMNRALDSLRSCLEARGVDGAAAAEFLDWTHDEPYRQ